jgi:1,4-alpha-glucan branching enzyme/maltooligosyltrehalose trehalohydrolase
MLFMAQEWASERLFRFFCDFGPELAVARHGRWHELHRKLLALRRLEIVPRLAGMTGGHARRTLPAERALRVGWTLGDASQLTLLANLDGAPLELDAEAEGRLLYATSEGVAGSRRSLPAWVAAWYLRERAKA